MMRTQRTRSLAGIPAALWAAALAAPLYPSAARAAEGLVLLPRPDLLGALILLFVLLIAPVNRFLFQPLFKALEAREERIDGARERARRLEEEAETILRRCEASVREAREEAEYARRARLDEARAETQRAVAASRGEAEQRITHARSEVSVALQEARSALRAEAELLAQQAASQVLGRAL